jgi:hypothetical protein
MKQDDDDTDREEISDDESEVFVESTLSSDIEEDDLDNQQEVLHLDQARRDKMLRNNTGSTAKETEPCRYYHCLHFTSKSATSSRGHGTTIAQTPKVIRQHITRV